MSLEFEPHIVPLFSYPVLFTKDHYKFLENEFFLLNNQPYEKNINNLISKDKYVLEQDSFSNIKKWIQNHCNYYLKNVMSFEDINCEITQSWVNWTKQGQSHHIHSHPNSFLSGILFLSNNDSEITFSSRHNLWNLDPNVKKYNIFNSQTMSYPTELGRLIIFPSSLQHEVKKQKNKNVRISLSFNTWIKGKLGYNKDSNYLEL